MRSPSRSAARRCDADRPVGAGEISPSALGRAPLDAGQSSVETIARLDASSKPGAEIAVDDDGLDVAVVRGPQEPELRRACA